MRLKFLYIILSIMLQGLNKYSIAQNRITSEITGILIYHKTEKLFPQKERIPEEVVFLPLRINASMIDLNVCSLLEIALNQNDSIGLVTYFQGMRWRNPSLARDLMQTRQVEGILSDTKWRNITDTVIIAIGKIIFDKTSKRLDIESTFTDNVFLKCKKNSFHFIIKDLPKEMGFPILFEKIE
jgi:hypothetical protein